MINNEFWKDAAFSWSWKAKLDVNVKTGSGGQISSELLKKPWEVFDDEEYVDFNKVDYDASVKSMMSGGDVILKDTNEEIDKDDEICIDSDRFDSYLEEGTISGFVNCFKMLIDCGLPENVTEKFREMVKRLVVLDESVSRFKKVYETDLSMFVDNYIPEALNLTVGYIEYVNAKVDENILESTKAEIVEAVDTLLVGVNDKIDEIYKFASIELKAAAKALNATMNLDGYVDPKFKIN